MEGDAPEEEMNEVGLWKEQKGERVGAGMLKEVGGMEHMK